MSANSIAYPRKSGDTAPNKYTWDFINRNGYLGLNEVIPLEGTVAAATAALPQVATVVQEYNPFIRVSTPATVVCAGTIQKIGDTYGVLITDSPAASTAAFATRGRFRVLLNSGATAAVGADAYIDPANMEVSETATAREYLGKFTSVNEVNPEGGPAGTYAIVSINQTEK